MPETFGLEVVCYHDKLFHSFIHCAIVDRLVWDNEPQQFNESTCRKGNCRRVGIFTRFARLSPTIWLIELGVDVWDIASDEGD